MVKFLLESGAKAGCCDVNYITPLQTAGQPSEELLEVFARYLKYDGIQKPYIRLNAKNYILFPVNVHLNRTVDWIQKPFVDIAISVNVSVVNEDELTSYSITNPVADVGALVLFSIK